MVAGTRFDLTCWLAAALEFFDYDAFRRERRPMLTEFIGWTAAFILLLTVGRQVYVQWRDRSSSGLSKWLFIGQMSASACFVVYSLLLGSWVFVVTNAAMLLTAVIGQILMVRNQKSEAAPHSPAKAAAE